VDVSTIAAIATAPGKGAVGIIRVSGKAALTALGVVAPGVRLEPRRATVVTLQVAGAPVDQALTLFFPGPNSYTGEDVVELQTHGAPRLLQLLLSTLVSSPGVRLAQPGEFTRRALANGRLSWSRAEAVVELIDARSEDEVKAAASRLTGALSTVLEELYQPLLDVSATLEGALDFPDEAGDVDVADALASCLDRARLLERSARRSENLRRGGLVVLYGPVNAGKSTLFNRLIGSERALVDDEPGTTRDALEAVVELGGQAVTLVDTAGLREAPGRLEALGITRTLFLLEACDLAVLVAPPNATETELCRWREQAPESKRLEVAGKGDLRPPHPALLTVSGRSGLGVEVLINELLRRLNAGGAGSDALASGHHLEALVRARAALERAVEALPRATLEVVAGEVSLALAAVAEVAGLNVTEQRLDALFARFCVGK
jgi:tRNA modification GTPase